MKRLTALEAAIDLLDDIDGVALGKLNDALDEIGKYANRALVDQEALQTEIDDLRAELKRMQEPAQ